MLMVHAKKIMKIGNKEKGSRYFLIDLESNTESNNVRQRKTEESLLFTTTEEDYHVIWDEFKSSKIFLIN